MKISNQEFKWATFLHHGPLKFIVLFILALCSPLIIARLLPYNGNNFVKEIAVAAGMLALMLFIIAFFYTGRFNFVSKVRGIDLTLMIHRRIVFIAVVLIILHVVLISAFAMPDNFIPLIVVFLLIISQVIMVKIRQKMKMKYERWRVVHEIWAIAIVAIIVLHAISDGKYSAQPVMAGFWIGALIVAVGSLLYVHHYLPIANSKKPYKIIELKEIANKQWNLVLEPKGNFEPLQFHPGQFAFVSFGWSALRNVANPFSFSSAPSDLPQISFTIKEVGDLTSSFKDMPLDTEVFLYGPYGHMNRDLHKGPPDRGIGSVLIASGIGITPMISMLRDSVRRNDSDPIKLIYACRYEEDIIYREELEEYAKLPHVDVHLILSKPTGAWQGKAGRVDREFLCQLLNFDGYTEYLYFICGQTRFIHDTIKYLEELEGIPVFNVLFEDFSIYN